MKGSILKEPNGTYTVLWSTVDPATGKRRQHKRRGFERKESAKPPRGDSAREFLNGIIGSVTDGSWRRSADFTVKELLNEHWLPAQRLRGLRPATIAQYEAVADHWIVPFLGGVKVAALRSAQVAAWVETLRTAKSARGRKGLSTRSMQLSVGVLKSACAWAVQNELLARNPVAGVRRPRVEPTTMKAWSIEDARAFLEASKTDRLALAWTLLLTRGLRRGELCGLRWPNIDLDGGVLQVVETLVVVDGQPVNSTPKTNAGRRSVPLDAHLVALLRSHKVKQAAERLKAGESYQDQGYVLADELGQPPHPDTVSGWFDAAVTKAKLPRIRLHDTRHTAASLMLASGVPTKVVSEMLGHSSPTITLSIYAHVLPGMSEDAGEQLSTALLA